MDKLKKAIDAYLPVHSIKKTAHICNPIKYFVRFIDSVSKFTTEFKLNLKAGLSEVKTLDDDVKLI